MRKLIEAGNRQHRQSAVHTSVKHESAARQVQGGANYIDDIVEPQGTLYAAVGLSQQAAGNIKDIDLSDVRASEGVVDVITIDDVPGHKDIGPVFAGDPLLAHHEIKFYGQPYFAVLATSVNLARQAALKGKITLEDTSPTLTVDSALAKQSFVRPTHEFGQGNVEQQMADATHKASGTLSIGGQEHMYLEGQVSLAIPDEDDRMKIYTSKCYVPIHSEQPPCSSRLLCYVPKRSDHALSRSTNEFEN